MIMNIHFSLLQYELLFCIENKNDPAIPIVEGLMKKYPNVDAQLFIGKYFREFD